MIKQKQKGMIALTAILIVGAVVLFIGLGVTMRSILESNSSLYEELSARALSMATSCMEQSLLSLADNSSYNGNETITIGTNTCTILPIIADGDTREVQTSSTVNGHTRRLLVNVSNVNPPLQISSWQEINN